MSARSKLLIIGVWFIWMLSGCGQSQPTAAAPVQDIEGEHCSLDGMALADYPGPKAQIHYAQGSPDFFCDVVEMFSIYLQPEQQRRINGMYVNDMAKADWDHPTDHWIDARTAFYVAGSRRRGSMGPTLASFASEADARNFATKEGGQVLAFSQITPDMVTLDGGVLKDRRM